MKHLVLLILSILLSAGTFYAGARLSYFRVETEGDAIVVSWQAVDEKGLRRYELLRKTRFSSNQFIKVATISPHGTEKPYRYQDDQVYKTASEQVDYLLEAVYADGEREKLGEQSVNYTPTAVRRTWGSIKAMFQ